MVQIFKLLAFVFLHWCRWFQICKVFFHFLSDTKILAATRLHTLPLTRLILLKRKRFILREIVCPEKDILCFLNQSVGN